MLYLSFDQKQAIKRGYLGQLNPSEIVVLLTIEAFTDLHAKAYPSQDTISRVSGVSVNSVKRATKSLEEKGFIWRTRKDKKSVTHYVLQDIPLPENVKTDQDNEQGMTAKDFLELFKRLYLETYETPYLNNDRHDLSQIKAKFIGNYTDEQLEAILKITFRDYSIHWSNPRFPRPVIGGVCGFIGSKALEIWEAEQEKEKRVVEAEQENLSKYFNQRF